ncbi:hypothetical protein FOS14_07715 [Skermania sp. ID1734]|uniref:hypothetical protein n=1 Tax=Skermania sp. ID1734 TaxID=2597516 RepID=UPI00117DABFA|nr:hypothetical protein [Skermania sp. ID1734]TSE00307.1 hypothetical protein FOS14_07715 [Skermania sp. ID1734]
MSRIRNTAVALASVASMALTAAAASIVLSDLGRPAPDQTFTFDLRPPRQVHAATPQLDGTKHAVAPAASTSADAPVQQKLVESVPANVTETIRRTESAVVPGRVYDMQLATNLLDRISNWLRGVGPSTGDDPNTEVVSEFDVDRDGVIVTVTDPALGSKTLELHRKPAPSQEVLAS